METYVNITNMDIANLEIDASEDTKTDFVKKKNVK